MCSCYYFFFVSFRLKVYHERCLPKPIHVNENDKSKVFKPKSSAIAIPNNIKQNITFIVSSDSTDSIRLCTNSSAMFGSQSEQNMVFSHPVSFSESSSTFAEYNQQENMAASSFIEYSGHFPDFLPEGASDYSR